MLDARVADREVLTRENERQVHEHTVEHASRHRVIKIVEVNVAAHVRAAHPLGQPLQRVEAAHLTCFQVAERREQARVLVRVLFRFRLIPAEQATEALLNRLHASVAASIVSGRGNERGRQTTRIIGATTRPDHGLIAVDITHM